MNLIPESTKNINIALDQAIIYARLGKVNEKDRTIRVANYFIKESKTHTIDSQQLKQIEQNIKEIESISTKIQNSFYIIHNRYNHNYTYSDLKDAAVIAMSSILDLNEPIIDEDKIEKYGTLFSIIKEIFTPTEYKRLINDPKNFIDSVEYIHNLPSIYTQIIQNKSNPNQLEKLFIT